MNIINKTIRHFKLTYYDFKKIADELIVIDTFSVIFLVSNINILDEWLRNKGVNV